MYAKADTLYLIFNLKLLFYLNTFIFICHLRNSIRFSINLFVVKREFEARATLTARHDVQLCISLLLLLFYGT